MDNKQDQQTNSTDNSSLPSTSNASGESSFGSNLAEHPINKGKKPASPLTPGPIVSAPAPPLNQPKVKSTSAPQPLPKSDSLKKPQMLNKDSSTKNPPPNSPLSGSTPPPDQKQNLEKKAEVMLKDLGNGNNPGSKFKSKTSKIVLGIIALLVLGLGSFTAFKLVLTPGVGDVRQQASEDDYGSYGGNCNAGWYECNVGCCGTGGGAYDGQRYSPHCGEGTTWYSNEPVPDECKDAVEQELNDHGLATNENGTIILNPEGNLSTQEILASNPLLLEAFNNGTCFIVGGGYLYCGGYRDGTACEPILNGGGDWCQVIGGPGALCSELGLIRCACSNGVGVIGSNNQSCNDLCGGTDNICESCPGDSGDSGDGGDSGGETHITCVDDTCQVVNGTGQDTCAIDADCVDESHSACENYACIQTPGPGTDECTNNSDCIPNQSLVCESLNHTPAIPKLNDSLTFTCNGIGNNINIDHYEFRYSVNNGSYAALSESSPGLGTSEALTISQLGTYQIQCRACSSTNSTACTPYQAITN